MPRVLLTVVGLTLIVVGLIMGSRVYYFNDDRFCGSVLRPENPSVYGAECDAILESAAPAVEGPLKLGIGVTLVGGIWIITGAYLDHRRRPHQPTG